MRILHAAGELFIVKGEALATSLAESEGTRASYRQKASECIVERVYFRAAFRSRLPATGSA